MITVENSRNMKKIRVNKRILQQAGIKKPAFFFDKLNKTEWITVVMQHGEQQQTNHRW